MELKLITILSIIFDTLAFFLIIFLLIVKTERKQGNILLAIFLFFYALDSNADLVSKFIYPESISLGLFVSNQIFLLMPFLYLFFLSSIYKDFKLTYKSLLHAIPFIVFTILCFYSILGKEMKGVLTEQEISVFFNGPVVKVIYISLHLQVLAYFIAIFYNLFVYKLKLRENFSNSDFGNYKWLNQLWLILLIENLVSIVKNISYFARWPHTELLFNIVMVNIVLFIGWLMIKALLNPGLFSGIYTDVQLVKNLVNASDMDPLHAKFMNNDLSSEEIQFAESLEQYMIDEEPFLDSGLTMAELAEQLNMSSKALSIFINHKLGKHFFDFVNEFRIRKAQELLENTGNSDMTVLEILYQVGFNSKSSFNTLFRKHTGLTPTEYRKRAWRSAA